MADVTDTNLVNPWGIAFSATSPFWISDNHAGVSTLYNGAGTPSALIVTVPPAAGGTPPSAPTGVIFNGTTGFTVASNAPARFIFSTENGTIVGWNSGPNGVLKVDNSTNGAIYKGLAIAKNGTNSFLYATDFHNGKVDVFDSNYNPVTLPGAFSDPNIPPGFAPFGIEPVNGKLFVTYALQDPDRVDDIGGPGHGFVDVFDPSGQMVQRFATSNELNSPWGIALAPQDFGPFSGALLVGNFGNGVINAFNAADGSFLGALRDASGNLIAIPGLWAIKFGNGGSGGDVHTLYFTAGIPGPGALEDHGLFGSISAVYPSFTAVTDKGLATALGWAGGAGRFLLQKKSSLSDSNWFNVLTTPNRSSLVPKDDAANFWRLLNQATNTVLPFSVYLNGASEIPPVNTSATAVGTLSIEGSNLTYHISYSGLSSPATTAHLHGPADPNTPAGVLFGLSGTFSTSGILSGTHPLTLDQFTAIISGQTYVNIHTAPNPNGEIRSQVVPLHIPVTLNGASEVPPVTTSASGTASLTLLGNQLLYTISYAGLTGPATGSHLHGPAPAGSNAPVIVPFVAPSGTSGSISGTATLTPTQLGYLLSGQTYVNVHSTTNAGGEIRGQVNPIQLVANLNGASEVGPTASPATALGSFIVSNSILYYSVAFTNLLSPATGAHIHGPADSAHNGPVIIPFSAPATTSGVISGSAILTPNLLFYLMTGQTYANIHTTNYPGGEIRGQVLPNN